MDPTDPRPWQAVIDKAFANAQGDDPVARRVARRWLTTPGKWISTVCDRCGLDPDELRKQAIALFGTEPEQRKVKVQKPKAEAKPKSTRPKHGLIQITHDGETRTIREWSEIIGLPVRVIHQRLQRGYPTLIVLHPGKLPCGHIARRTVAKHQAEPELHQGNIPPGPGG